MLKIKDNVDLKELEKYGIRKGYQLKMFLGKDDEREELSIHPEMRIINIGRDLWWDKNYYYGFVKMDSNKSGEDILYDLIKDGLVEKVQDDCC